jgi:hypothetical protein
MFSLCVAHATTGQTPIGARLRQILEIYVPRIEDPSLHHKPISIVVITDGAPSESLDTLSDFWALTNSDFSRRP